MGFDYFNADQAGQNLIGGNDRMIEGLLMLQKSLEAGVQSPVSGGGSGAALMYQSIEGTIQRVTQTIEHAAFWRALPKDANRVTNTTDEWRRQTALGAVLDGGSPEGAVGPSKTGTYEYAYDRVKYITQKREISDVMLQLPTIVGGQNALAEEDTSASTDMTLTLNRAALWGEVAKNPYVFDGLAAKCHAQGNVHNMDKGLFDPYMIRGAAQEIKVRAGNPQIMWMSSGLQSDLDEMNSQYVRRTVLDGRDAMIGGRVAVGINFPNMTAEKLIRFEHDIALDPYNRLLTHTGIGETVPTTPTASVGFASPVDATSKANAADAGNWYFKVVSVGLKGESAPLASGAVAVSDGDSVTVTVAALTDSLYLKLYAADGPNATAPSDFYLVGTYAVTSGVATAITYLFGGADNEYRPNTYCAFIVQPDAYIWRQLTDFFRKQLAQTALTVPFVYGVYGYIRWAKPEWMYMVKNIKPATIL